jgi:hypothetical protein
LSRSSTPEIDGGNRQQHRSDEIGEPAAPSFIRQKATGDMHPGSASRTNTHPCGCLKWFTNDESIGQDPMYQQHAALLFVDQPAVRPRGRQAAHRAKWAAGSSTSLRHTEDRRDKTAGLEKALSRRLEHRRMSIAASRYGELHQVHSHRMRRRGSDCPRCLRGLDARLSSLSPCSMRPICFSTPPTCGRRPSHDAGMTATDRGDGRR